MYKLKKEKKWKIVFFCKTERKMVCFFFYFIFLFYFFIFFTNFLFIFKKEFGEKKKENWEEVLGKERKTYFSTPHLRAENVHALKMFDDICKYIKKYKNDKNKIYLMYVMLNEEFLELCKNQESTNLEPFKLVISFFFSKRIVLELEDVSGVGLPV